MSEYTIKEEVRQQIKQYSFSSKTRTLDCIVFIVVSPEGNAVKEFSDCDFDYTMQAKQAAQGYANEHNLAHYKQEIASLQEAAAEKDSVIEAQSEEVADLRGFIRSIFPMENPSDVRYANVYIQELISKWESAAQAQSAEGE